jgi:hypothetical protein
MESGKQGIMIGVLRPPEVLKQGTNLQVDFLMLEFTRNSRNPNPAKCVLKKEKHLTSPNGSGNLLVQGRTRLHLSRYMGGVSAAWRR